jgi:hypothetical protein
MIAPFKLLLLSFFISLSALATQESPQSFNFQGRLFNSAGTAPLEELVGLKFQIFDPSGTCLLYQETQNFDLTNTSGVFAVSVGSATGAVKRTVGTDPGLLMKNIFKNDTTVATRAALSANCAAGYTPTAGDVRLLRITVTPTSTGTPEVLSPDQTINNVPQALVAETLQGLGPTDFVQKDPVYVTTAAIDMLFGSLLGGVVDATTLHTHDDRYIQIGDSSSSNLGSGGFNTTGASSVGVGTNFTNTTMSIQTIANASVGMSIKAGAAGQTADLFKLLNSAGTTLASFSKDGSLGITNTVGNQFVTGYDTTNKVSMNVSSTGTTTFTAAGTAPQFSFMGGNVGIGVASPNQKLSVLGQTYINNIAGLELSLNSSGTNYAHFYDPGFAGASGGIALGGAGISTIPATPTMFWNINNGNVGIGTSAPSTLLNITKNTNGFASNIYTQFFKIGGDTTGYPNGGYNSLTMGIKGVYDSYIATEGNDIHILSGKGVASENHNIKFYTGFAGAGGQAENNLRMSLMSTGNLGLGTGNPPELLSMAGSNAGTSISSDGVTLTINNSNATANNISSISFAPFETSGNGFSRLGVIHKDRTGGSEDQDMFFGTIGAGVFSEVMRLSNTGYVGIGTPTPASLLNLYSTSGSVLSLESDQHTDINRINFVAVGGAYHNIQSDTQNGNFDFRAGDGGSGHRVRFFIDGSEKMRINNTGNVGIGTPSPSAMLHVLGTAGGTVMRIINSGGNTGLRMDNGDLKAQFYGSGGINYPSVTSGADNTAGIGFQGGPAKVSIVTGSTARLIVDNAGQVGIGNPSPSYPLDVSGDIRTTGCLYYNASSIGTCVSDRKLKKEISPFTLGLDEVLGLNPVHFKYNGLSRNPNDGVKQLGVIAQDVEKVAPSLVVKKGKYKAVNYGAFTYMFINAFKEMYQKITNTDEELKELKAENIAMKEYLCTKDAKAPFCNRKQ